MTPFVRAIKLCFFVAILICIGADHANAQLITTVVGGGYASGQSAMNIGIGPQNTTLDAAGNLVVADFTNSRVFKLDQSTGLITVISGLGIIGNYGDGGPAAGACFYRPNDVAYDRHGNLFVADFNNNKIRKIDTAGIITTYAGEGSFAYGGDGGPAVLAQLNRPAGVYVDASDNLYIADEFNSRIRKVSPAGIISTIAGTGALGFSGDDSLATNAALYYPTSVKQDKAGNIIIVDYGNDRLRRIDAAGIITTFAGGGGSTAENIPATNAQLNFPLVATVDTSGNIYFSEYGANRIRKISTSGIISLVAGTGTLGFSGDGGQATAARFRRPVGVTVDKAGSLYLCDYDPSSIPHTNCRIRKIDASGVINTIAGDSTVYFGGNGDPSVAGQLYNPSALAIDSKGAIYVTDSQYFVRKSNASGIISTYAGSHYYHSLSVYTPALYTRFGTISAMVTDPAGNLYLADEQYARVRKIDTNGMVTTFAGGGLPAVLGDGGPATAAYLIKPTGLAFDKFRNLYVADNGAYRVRKIDTAGVISTIVGIGIGGTSGNESPATMARVTPYGLAIDDSGRLYISDNMYRIRMVDTAGFIHAFAGAGSALPVGDGGPATAACLNKPQGMATDHNGNLYIADFANNRVRCINSAGIISTLAGNGIAYYYGDGQDIAFSEVDGPTDVKVDADGNVLFADMNNFRVRKVWLNTGVSNIANVAKCSLLVSPNPTTGWVNADIVGSFVVKKWVLTDMRGVQLLELNPGNTNNGHLHLDLSSFRDGVYVLHCVGETQRYTAKVLLFR